jgi:hypothetical protein
MPRQVFTAGEILTAASMNDLSDATVMVFDDSAARGSAIPSPVEGMVTYLKDTNQVQAYNGAAFAPLGTILQVVSTTKTDAFSTTSATFTDVTGLSATITPSSATSKILVVSQVTAGVNSSSGDGAIHARMLRDSTVVNVGDAAGSNRVQSAFSFYGNIGQSFSGLTGALSSLSNSINFVDSPATTSSVTYKVQVRVNNGGIVGAVNRNSQDNDVTHSGRSVSSIILMEVAG